MLAAAALVPETPLLVPGAAGTADVLAAVREAALAAVAELLAAGPDRVVVVVPARARAGGAAPSPDAPDPFAAAAGAAALVPTLGAAGIPDRVLGWPPVPLPTSTASAGGAVLRVDDVATSVALLLLVGSLSARRGPDAPLPDDPRAAAVDDALAADLADLGTDARRRLADLPADLAAELAISARGPWRVLLAASSDVDLQGRTHRLDAPYGATYAVLSWQPA